MGLSAIVLFKVGESVPLSELMAFLEKLTDKKHLKMTMLSQKTNDNEKLVYSNVIISLVRCGKESTKQLELSMADETYGRSRFTFSSGNERQEYIRAIITGDIDDNAPFAFDILYSLLKKYPQARINTEFDWLYSLDDFKMMAKRPYNKAWYYQNPTDVEL